MYLIPNHFLSVKIKLILIGIILLVCITRPSDAQTIRDVYEQAVDAYNKGDYDRSVTLYQALTKDSPHFAPAYVGIGLALKAKGADIDEVLYYYRTAVQMDPTNTQALEQLGRLYYSINRFDKAEKVFVKALKIDPGMKDVKLSLAWIYLLYKSRPELAKKYFQDILKVNQDPSVYLGLGMADFANNDRVAALDMVTYLKSKGHEDYAKRLEQAMRENRKVIVNQENSNQLEDDQSPADDSSQIASKPVQQPMPTSSHVPDSGVKVRLRGKLSQINN